MAKLKITLVRSLIGRPETQRKIVRAMGLTKVNSFVIREDCPQVRGVINKIPHLLQVEEV